MSSVTEPYPPQERTTRHTRALLEEMVERPPDFPVIQSHTPLVVDDLSLLAVNALELAGQRYLVAPRRDTQWVRNLRATGRGELRRRGRIEPLRATEIVDDEKPPIIEAYLARWGYQVRPYFRALPHPADHPVFRIERS